MPYLLSYEVLNARPDIFRLPMRVSLALDVSRH